MVPSFYKIEKWHRRGKRDSVPYVKFNISNPSIYMPMHDIHSRSFSPYILYANCFYNSSIFLPSGDKCRENFWQNNKDGKFAVIFWTINTHPMIINHNTLDKRSNSYTIIQFYHTPILSIYHIEEKHTRSSPQAANTIQKPPHSCLEINGKIIISCEVMNTNSLVLIDKNSLIYNFLDLSMPYMC